MDGQHYWATGKPGNEEDLAGLVCNDHGNLNCINPARGLISTGMTWAQREWELRRMDRKIKAALEEWEWSKNRFNDAA